MQQQVWQTVNQIAESVRKTFKVQFLNILISISYLLGIMILIFLAKLTLTSLMWLIFACLLDNGGKENSSD
jgi:hypothetical protein